MEIKINEGHKSEFDAAASKVAHRAEELKQWRHNHPDPSGEKVGELVDLYHSLGESRQELKSAIEHYYGISI